MASSMQGTGKRAMINSACRLSSEVLSFLDVLKKKCSSTFADNRQLNSDQ